MPRQYELKRRAERQEQTRQRIIDATVELHQELGMARTTISDIAQRAGVERATVYRHFPEEAQLFSACTSRYFEEFPFPDPEPWLDIREPVERLRTGLEAIYAFHKATEKMMERTLREVFELPAAQEVAAQAVTYWEGVTLVLAAGWDVDEEQSRLVSALVGHAIDFWTWQSLVRKQGLTQEQAIRAMLNLVECHPSLEPVTAAITLSK